LARFSDAVVVGVPQDGDLADAAGGGLAEEYVAVRRERHEARERELVGEDVDVERGRDGQPMPVRGPDGACGLAIPGRRERRRERRSGLLKGEEREKENRGTHRETI